MMPTSGGLPHSVRGDVGFGSFPRLQAAAVALAEEMAGTEADFALEMNLRAFELGRYDTTFVNASGRDPEDYVDVADNGRDDLISVVLGSPIAEAARWEMTAQVLDFGFSAAP